MLAVATKVSNKLNNLITFNFEGLLKIITKLHFSCLDIQFVEVLGCENVAVRDVCLSINIEHVFVACPVSQSRSHVSQSLN